MIPETFKDIEKYADETGFFEFANANKYSYVKNMDKLDSYLLSEIYQINNGLIKDIMKKPEYLNKIKTMINESVYHRDMYWYALSTSKYFPKEILLAESVKNKHLAYALFQRDDLSKKEIKALMDFISIADFRTFLSDKTSYIHPNNIDIICNLPPSSQRIMQYRCFSKINNECELYGNLSPVLLECPDPELISTALLDNPNLSDGFKKKIYAENGIRIEFSNNPPKFVLQDIYPSVAEIIFNPKLTEDKSITKKAYDTMGRFLHNNALSDAMLLDFTKQALMPPGDKRNFYGLSEALTLVNDGDTIKSAIKLSTPDAIISVMKNKNFPSNLLREIKPKIDFYMANKTKDMQKMFIISMIDTKDALKDMDFTECKKYIDNEDEIAMKLMVTNPYAPNDILKEILNYVSTIDNKKIADSYMVLFDLKTALKDATQTSQQFLAHKFLEYQLSERNIESEQDEPDFITTELFLKEHHFVNKDAMNCGGYDTIHTLSKIEKLIDTYKKEGKETESLNQLRDYVYGFKEFRVFAEVKQKFLTEKDGRFCIDLETFYERIKDHKMELFEDFDKMLYEAKKIFLQELSKELIMNDSVKYPYKNFELIANIFMDAEGIYQKLVNEIEKRTPEEMMELGKSPEEKER